MILFYNTNISQKKRRILKRLIEGNETSKLIYPSLYVLCEPVIRESEGLRTLVLVGALKIQYFVFGKWKRIRLQIIGF